MNNEDFEQLKQLLARLKEETEDYVGHDKLVKYAESLPWRNTLNDMVNFYYL